MKESAANDRHQLLLGKFAPLCSPHCSLFTVTTQSMSETDLIVKQIYSVLVRNLILCTT